MNPFKKQTYDNTTSTAYSSFGQGVSITGDLESSDDIRLDGSLKGNINCSGKVIIAQSATVNGNIHGANVEIAGTVIGTIQSAISLKISLSAKIEGEITTGSLDLEQGAILKGKCRTHMQQVLPEAIEEKQTVPI